MVPPPFDFIFWRLLRALHITPRPNPSILASHEANPRRPVCLYTSLAFHRQNQRQYQEYITSAPTRSYMSSILVGSHLVMSGPALAPGMEVHVASFSPTASGQHMRTDLLVAHSQGATKPIVGVPYAETYLWVCYT